MGKVKKILVALLLAILTAFSFAGCASDTDGLQDKIDGLQSRIEELEAQLQVRDEQIAQLEGIVNKLAENNSEAIVETTLYSNVGNCKDFIAICNSLDEFKEKCLSNGYDFFDENNDHGYYNSDAGKKIREYTDEYFEDKSFVVCAFYKSSWAGQYLIDKVEVKSNKLTLYVKYPRSDTADDVVNDVFLIVGIDKALVADITDLEYVLC